MTFLFGKTSRVSFSFFHSSLVIPRFFTCLVRIGSQKCSFSLHSTFYRVAGCWHAGFLFFLQSPWVRNEQLRFVLGESRLSLLRQNSALLPARQGSCKVQPSARSRRAQDLGTKQNGADAAAAFSCATGWAVTADTPWPWPPSLWMGGAALGEGGGKTKQPMC